MGKGGKVICEMVKPKNHDFFEIYTYTTYTRQDWNVFSLPRMIQVVPLYWSKHQIFT